MSQSEVISCEVLGKRYRRYSSKKPRLLKDLALGNWRGLGPESTLWALRDVSFTLQRGRMLGVIGCNGAGKSTLLRLIGGVSAPDKGSVRVRGRVGALLDLGLGFHPDLTGRENVFVNGVIAGLTRREVAGRLDAIVAFAELESFIDAPLRTYSTGMRMRLGFAIAAHTDPDLLLIDEVLSVGDMSFQNKCMERIAHFKCEGVGVLLVSHNLHEVKLLCDDVLWLERGEVRRHGPTTEVVAAYEASVSAVSPSPEITPVVTKTALGVPLKMHENRFGTLEVELTAACVPTEVASGDPVEVELHYLAHRPMHQPIFQVKLVRADGVVCCDVNSQDGELLMPTLKGEGRIRMRIDRQYLAGGSYFVDIGVYHADWERMLDYHAHAYQLRVVGPTPGESILAPPARWELMRAQVET